MSIETVAQGIADFPLLSLKKCELATGIAGYILCQSVIGYILLGQRWQNGVDPSWLWFCIMD